jgi:hypothetical protein
MLHCLRAQEHDRLLSQNARARTAPDAQLGSRPIRWSAVMAALEPAFAALAGSTIGGLTTLAVTWISQRTQARAALTARDRTTRYTLYKYFTEEASKLYGDALVHNTVEIPTLIGAYALISRMRIISSSEIVDKAEAALRTIVDVYLSPNKTIADVRQEIDEGKLDLLRDFSHAARAELSTLKY